MKRQGVGMSLDSHPNAKSIKPPAGAVTYKSEWEHAG